MTDDRKAGIALIDGSLCGILTMASTLRERHR